jgi:hypothetical protein
MGSNVGSDVKNGNEFNEAITLFVMRDFISSINRRKHDMYLQFFLMYAHKLKIITRKLRLIMINFPCYFDYIASFTKKKRMSYMVILLRLKHQKTILVRVVKRHNNKPN